MIPSINEFNTAPTARFIDIVNILFETAEPLSQSLLASRPYDSYTHLIDNAQNCIKKISLQEKIQVVNAHPRIGAPVQTLSALSLKEQGNHKQGQKELDDIMKELNLLNDEYERTFGFKFVVFVNGRSRKEIIPIIKERLNNSPEAELLTGLDAMILIARDRLSKIQESKL